MPGRGLGLADDRLQEVDVAFASVRQLSLRQFLVAFQLGLEQQRAGVLRIDGERELEQAQASLVSGVVLTLLVPVLVPLLLGKT